MNESVVSSKKSKKINEDEDDEGSEQNGEQHDPNQEDEVDEDGIKKIKPVIVSDDKHEVYHLSTGNMHLEGNNELGIKSRKSKRMDTGELIESKSVLIS